MMMNPMMTIEGIAERSAEMWRTGETSRQIVDFVLKSVSGLQGDAPLREVAADTFCADFFHPFNLSKAGLMSTPNCQIWIALLRNGARSHAIRSWQS